MTSYEGAHARLYDLFYTDKDYAREARFVDGVVGRYGGGPPGPLLDLACGTGRHAIEFRELGYAVTGVDHSPDMLDIARARAGGSVRFEEADMRRFELNGRFGVVACLFDSIGYAATTQGVVDVLRAVRSSLDTAGLFVCEFWHEPAMVGHFEPVRLRRWDTPDGEIIRLSETELRPDEHLAEVRYTIIDLRSDPSVLRETQTNRYFTMSEMDSLLTSSGFEPLEWFAGYAEDEEITDETFHVVVAARSKD